MPISAQGFHVRLIAPRTTPALSELPICASDGDYPDLRIEDGCPVWPVEGAVERDLLGEVASLFGSTVRTVSGERSSAATGSGEVVGVGDIADETCLYAHLTRRSHRLVGSVEELAADQLPEVVLIVDRGLKRELLVLMMEAPSKVEAPGNAPATGIIWASSKRDLRRQVLMRSAAAALSGPLTTARAEVSYTHKGVARAANGDLRVGAGASAAEIKAALTARAGVLVLQHHGDGWRVFFDFDHRLALCTHAEPPLDGADEDRAPPCVASGHCEFTEEPVVRSVEGARLLHPEDISARVLVNFSCHAVLADTPLVDSSWGYTRRLVESPRVGCLVATPDLSTYPSVARSDIADPLIAGLEVGRALAGYQQIPEMEACRHRLLLFGDPRVKAVPEADRKMMIRPTVSRLRPVSSDDERSDGRGWDPHLAELALMHDLAGVVLGGEVDERPKQTSRALLRAIRDLDAAVDDGARIPAATAMRSAAIAHIASLKGRLSIAWVPRAAKRREDLQPCPYCGMSIRPFAVTLRTGLMRTFVACPACSEVVDQPYGAGLRTVVELPRIVLDGFEGPKDWTAAVLVIPWASQNVGEIQAFPWPADESGSPRRELVLEPPHWPAGIFSLKVVMVAGTALSVLGGRAKASELETTGAPR